MEHVRCNLCGADDTVVRFPSTMPEDRANGHPANPEHFYCTTLSYGQHYRIVQCRQCGLVYTNPRRRPAEILNDYEAVVEPRYIDEQGGRVLTFQRNIRPLEALIPSTNGHRLLDVGAHVGIFVQVAQERGWDAWGLEPSKWAAEEGQKRGINMIQGTLHQAELDPASFDVVTMWDVAEHLPDPLADFTEAARVLKPDGILCIHSMNIESLFAHAMGKHWPWLVEMHLYYYSPQTLTALVEKAGLKVESWRVQGRYLHLGYLVSRLAGWNKPLGQLAEKMARILHMDRWIIPVNFGDLFTLYARKPKM